MRLIRSKDVKSNMVVNYTYSILNILHLANDITLQHHYKNYIAYHMLKCLDNPCAIQLERAYLRLYDAGVKT